MFYQSVTAFWSSIRISLLTVSGGLLLTGCFGGSSSSGDDPASPPGVSGPVELSAEEQAVTSAVSGIERITSARNAAEQAMSGTFSPASGSQSISSAGMGIAQVDFDQEIVCDLNSNGDGDGSWNFVEGGVVGVNEDDIPDFFKNPASLTNLYSQGTAVSDDAPLLNDQLIRSDCVITTSDGDVALEYAGAIDVMQLEEIHGEGRAVTARMGGITGMGVDNAPDTSESMSLAVDFDGELLGLVYKAEFTNCEGCRDADFSDFGNDAALNTAFSGFLEMEQTAGDNEFYWRVGDGPNQPLTMKTMESSSGEQGQALVNIDGRLASVQENTGCSFDVTYETHTPLRVNGYAGGGTETIGGEIGVTINDSGEVFDVKFSDDGVPTVRNSAGDIVTPPTDSQSAQACGFGSGDTGSSDGSIEGQWVSDECELGISEDWPYIRQKLDFDLNQGNVEKVIEFHDNSNCSNQIGQFVAEQSVMVGAELPLRDAVEIDFLGGEVTSVTNYPHVDVGDSLSSVYDIYRIQNGQLYFGEPRWSVGPNSPSGSNSRENSGYEIDDQWSFSRP